MGDFQPLSSAHHTKGNESLQRPSPPATNLGVKVLPPYSDEPYKEFDFKTKVKVIEKALEHAPHAELHREVSSANKQLKSTAKTIGTSIMNGFGRIGAFIAGSIIAVVTKIITFSSCLATGGVSGLIMIPAAGVKAAIKMGENFKSYEQRIRSVKENQKKTSEWDSTKGKIHILHQAGMASARSLEPLSEKLFVYALGGKNEKLNNLNKKVDEVLGKGGSGIGIGTGTVISVTGLGIGAILGSVVGSVTLLSLATEEARNPSSPNVPPSKAPRKS